GGFPASATGSLAVPPASGAGSGDGPAPVEGVGAGPGPSAGERSAGRPSSDGRRAPRSGRSRPGDQMTNAAAARATHEPATRGTAGRLAEGRASSGLGDGPDGSNRNASC